ncbi:MFS transporter [Nonomuraea jiangxiensis]|uniref:Major Facilitator Superfamily protein n=1 Tax=Nonomuraea jiangxiensis TaxID=633440 RepID=A0A1G9FB98_9ACTN|nr:MFS transporter [Nonomuraea jiangxiensis]SDK85523.1 Major Facilitator Superfamily protein [Nonomuraea jiangxiensis]
MAGTRQVRHAFTLSAAHPSFGFSWLGSTLSMLGTRTLGVTYPLLAFWLTSSPTWTAWVMFAATVPALLCYIPAGAIIDRLGRRRVMVWSELGRAVLIALLCAGLLTDRLDVGLLLAIAFLEGGLGVLSSVAETALIPATVPKRDVETALALHETTVHAVVLTGRPLGGLLYGLGTLVPFVANALMFAFAALAVSRSSRGERPAEDAAGDEGYAPLTADEPAPAPTFLREIGAGLREVRDHPFLRTATLLTALINLAVQSLIVVFLSMAASTGLHPALVGLTLAASGVGGAFGAFISPARKRISKGIGRRAARVRLTFLAEWSGLSRKGRSMPLVHVWACAVGLGLVTLFSEATLAFAVALLIIGLTGGLSNVTIRTVLSRVPEHLMAKVVSVTRLGSYSSVALGPLVASVLVASVQVNGALVIIFLVTCGMAATATLVPKLRRALSPRLLMYSRVDTERA